MGTSPTLLLSGHDTVECSYYLAPGHACALDFGKLAFEKEKLRLDKNREPKPLTLAGREFLFYPYGTGSGYPYVIEDGDFHIAFGEYNTPSFFVKFKCKALWGKGLAQLHREFLDWVDAAGLFLMRPESLARVDFSFDYHLPSIDFDEDSFVTRAKKDSRYRHNGTVQTFQFGKSDVVLRVYDKVAEIVETSGKQWFFDLWERNSEVWRIEWQCRKSLLKRFGLLTIDDLISGQGDALHYLAEDHDTLRIASNDPNRSRWPLHPLWTDLQIQIQSQPMQGVFRNIDVKATLQARLRQLAVSTLGNLKQIAAIRCVEQGLTTASVDEALAALADEIRGIYDPYTWQIDVQKRKDKIRLGQ